VNTSTWWRPSSQVSQIPAAGGEKPLIGGLTVTRNDHALIEGAVMISMSLVTQAVRLWLTRLRSKPALASGESLKLKSTSQFPPLSGVICLLLVGTLTMGQVWHDKVSRKNAEGNRLYDQKNYSGATQKYVEAKDGKHHEQELAYNLANALYQQKKYPESLQELEKATSNDKLALNQKVYFNRGNTFFQMGKYPEAIESYKKALELSPGDREAKYNLELALKKLQENSQDQQKNSQKQDQKQNEKQDQKQSGQDQKDQNSEQKKQQQQSQPKDPEQKNAASKEQPRQDQNSQPPKPQQAGMDPKEALRILDALNQQEKQEQRKQALKIQRQRGSGKDW
jgi:Ca-activated chloride channel homolog